MKLGKRFTHLVTASLIAFSALSLTACGGGGGGSAITTPTNTSGRFLDAAVNGITYNCTLNSQPVSGVTANGGAFNCTPGSTVSFSVGSITLGSTASSGIITPINLAGTNANSTSPMVQAIVQLLVSLDPVAAASVKAGKPVTSLTIAPAVLTAASKLAATTISATTNQAAIDSWLTAIGAATGTSYLPSITPTQASAHISSTMNSVFQGNYSGSYTGAFPGTWSIIIDANGNVTGTTGGAGGVVPITGAVTTTLGATNSFNFTGFGGVIPWAGTLNVVTGTFSGTWDNIPTNTYTGTKTVGTNAQANCAAAGGIWDAKLNVCL